MNQTGNRPKPSRLCPFQGHLRTPYTDGVGSQQVQGACYTEPGRVLRWEASPGTGKTSGFDTGAEKGGVGCQVAYGGRASPGGPRWGPAPASSDTAAGGAEGGPSITPTSLSPMERTEGVKPRSGRDPMNPSVMGVPSLPMVDKSLKMAPMVTL